MFLRQPKPSCYLIKLSADSRAIGFLNQRPRCLSLLLRQRPLTARDALCHAQRSSHPPLFYLYTRQMSLPFYRVNKFRPNDIYSHTLQPCFTNKACDLVFYFFNSTFFFAHLALLPHHSRPASGAATSRWGCAAVGSMYSLSGNCIHRLMSSRLM